MKLLNIFVITFKFSKYLLNNLIQASRMRSTRLRCNIAVLQCCLFYV